MKATIAAALMALSATAASAERFSDSYDVYLGGFRIGEAEMRAELGPEGYDAKASASTAGLLAWAFGADFDAEAQGDGDPDAPRPRRFAVDGAFGGEPTSIEMTYDDAGVAQVSSDPPLRERSYDLPPERAAGALDPMSAALAVLAPRPPGELCGRTIPVFEGRRRFDIRLGPVRRSGDVARCRGVLVRVAGFKRKVMEQGSEFPFTAEWDASRDLARLDRAVLRTPLGGLVLKRR